MLSLMFPPYEAPDPLMALGKRSEGVAWRRPAAIGCRVGRNSEAYCAECIPFGGLRLTPNPPYERQLVLSFLNPRRASRAPERKPGAVREPCLNPSGVVQPPASWRASRFLRRRAGDRSRFLRAAQRPGRFSFGYFSLSA